MADVLVVEEDVDEAAQRAVVRIEVALQGRMALGEIAQRLADRAAFDLDLPLVAGEAPQGGGDVDGDAHQTASFSSPMETAGPAA